MTLLIPLNRLLSHRLLRAVDAVDDDAFRQRIADARTALREGDEALIAWLLCKDDPCLDCMGRGCRTCEGTGDRDYSRLE